MANFQQQTLSMNAPPGSAGLTGSVSVGAGTYTLTKGIASVAASDVPAALAAGWSLQPGGNWPAARLFTLTAPPASSGANWTSGAAITMPDGTTFTLSGYTIQVPQVWVSYLQGLGWTLNQ